MVTSLTGALTGSTRFPDIFEIWFSVVLHGITDNAMLPLAAVGGCVGLSFSFITISELAVKECLLKID